MSPPQTKKNPVGRLSAPGHDTGKKGPTVTQRRTAAGQFALEEQRRRLVAAASEAILEKGLSGVTLAHIANHAGISTGSVNFYFSSKEELLLETLKAVTDEFYQSVWSAVEQAGTSPADRLRALVLSATDPAIIKPGSAAVWYAFMSEAKSRSEYQEVCARHDDQLHFLITELCRAVIDLADPPVEHNADVIALAISGLIDIAWQGVLFDSEGFDCQQIRLQSLAFLATVFPWVFVPDPGSNLSSRDFGRKDVAVTVRAAAREDVPALARLINLYRQNQGSPSDLPGSGSWVEEQLLTQGGLPAGGRGTRWKAPRLRPHDCIELPFHALEVPDRASAIRGRGPAPWRRGTGAAAPCKGALPRAGGVTTRDRCACG